MKKKLLNTVRHFKSNAMLLHAAALALGYKVTYLTINGIIDINKLGFTVHHNQKVCYISNRAYFPGVSRWQLELMSNKILTSAALDNLSYTQIKTLVAQPSRQTMAQILIQADSLPLPVITKPSHGSGGFGIQLNRTEKALKEAVTTKYALHTSFLMQAYIEQPEYRILVIDGQVAYIHRKKFPEIIGDGTSTIAALLLGQKYCATDVIEHECTKHGFTLDSVLPTGTAIKTHFTRTSDPSFFISTNIPKNISVWSEKLCRALGVETVGIDAFIDGDLNNPSILTIIELNSKPSIYDIEEDYKNPDVLLGIAKTILKNYFKNK